MSADLNARSFRKTDAWKGIGLWEALWPSPFLRVVACEEPGCFTKGTGPRLPAPGEIGGRLAFGGNPRQPYFPKWAKSAEIRFPNDRINDGGTTKCDHCLCHSATASGTGYGMFKHKKISIE
jgi:hypothetical protein